MVVEGDVFVMLICRRNRSLSQKKKKTNFNKTITLKHETLRNNICTCITTIIRISRCWITLLICAMFGNHLFFSFCYRSNKSKLPFFLERASFRNRNVYVLGKRAFVPNMIFFSVTPLFLENRLR